MASTHIYNNDAIDENILENDQDEEEEDDEEENNIQTSQPDDDDDNDNDNDGDDGDDGDDDEEMEDDDNDNDNDNEGDNDEDMNDDDEGDADDDNDENENENDEDAEDGKESKNVSVRKTTESNISNNNNNNNNNNDTSNETKQKNFEQAKQLLQEDFENKQQEEQLSSKRKIHENGKEPAEKDPPKKLKFESENSGKGVIDNGSKKDGENESKALEKPTGASTSTTSTTSASKSSIPPEKVRENLILQSKIAENFDIIPSVAIPYSSQVHSLALSGGCKWLFTGGEDGFIRKYDFIASFEGQTPLTVAQRHSLVDSVTNAGVIVSYWENEQPVKKSQLKLKKNASNNANETYEPKLSPVYSLAVQSQSLWLLSGLRSGGITLQSLRHQEGSIQAYLKKHTDTISSLRLNNDEKRLLSGSWDKKLYEWDLDTGKVINDYKVITGQVLNIEYRPLSSLEIDTSKYAQHEDDDDDNKSDLIKDDDYDSLFGSDDDEDQTNANENGTAAANGNTEKTQNNDSAVKVESADGSVTIKETNTSSTQSNNKNDQSRENVYSQTGLDNNIFMSSTINGIINIWDRRTNKSVIDFNVPKNTPPWCMSSTWSADGERIYAGRRNNAVEEFDLKMPYSNFHNREPNVAKTLKFPSLSGPVYTVKALPNNRHLLCGSNDNIRLYDLSLHSSALGNTGSNNYNSGAGDAAKANSGASTTTRSAIPFQIIPGHHGGVLSNIYVDPTCRFMISASGDRGWQGVSTDAMLMYEIKTLMK